MKFCYKLVFQNLRFLNFKIQLIGLSSSHQKVRKI